MMVGGGGVASGGEARACDHSTNCRRMGGGRKERAVRVTTVRARKAMRKRAMKRVMILMSGRIIAWFALGDSGMVFTTRTAEEIETTHHALKSRPFVDPDGNEFLLHT
jgi:hypothetical protein